MSHPPKMSLAEQEAYKALSAIDKASEPYVEGEDIMTTIARNNLQRKYMDAIALMGGPKEFLKDFLDWYLRGPVYVSIPDEIPHAVDFYMKERFK